MRGVNRSRATVELYVGGVRVFLRWCAASSVAPELTKDAVNAFITDLLDSGAQPATAVARQKALRQYSKWLAAEGECKDDPLLGLAGPQQMTKVTDALDDDQLRALVHACSGRGLLDRRDEAIMRLMAETGVRAGELLALHVDDIDLDRGSTVVRKAKGGKQRRVPFGPKTVAALDRYLRARRASPSARLWIGVEATRWATTAERRHQNARKNRRYQRVSPACAAAHRGYPVARRRRQRARVDERGRVGEPRDAGPLHVGQCRRTGRR